MPGNEPSSERNLKRLVPDAKPVWRLMALRCRNGLMRIRWWYFRRSGMDIHPDTQISLKAHLDRTNPRGIHIGEGTLVAFGAVILSHDLARVIHTDTYIGKNCFIGAHAIILPGIRVGDNSIVATGSVVTREVASNTLVGGNPARVIRTDIRTLKWGILEESFQTAVQLQSDATG